MSFTLNLPWNKYGIIIELAKRLNGISPQFGKTALQKLIYLLTEIYGVPCDYEYSLYTYGPYSAELASNVDYVNALGGIELIDGLKGGYEIIVGEDAEHILSKAERFIKQYSDNIDQLIADFGSYSARDLELRTTLIYLSKNEVLSKEELARQLRDLKPYFSNSEINEVIDELYQHDYIKME